MLHAIGVLALILIGAVTVIEVWHNGLSPRWGRMLFRGWVVLSLLWMALVVVGGWDSIVAPPPAPQTAAFECGLPGLPPCTDLRVKTIDDALVAKLIPAEAPTSAPVSLTLERAEGLAEVALMPPIVLLVAGVACAWVLRGLRTT